MADERVERDVRRLGTALQRMGAAVNEPESSNKLWEDSAQAFIYAMDLFWKVSKELLADRGIEVHMPREAVHHAHERGWLEEDTDLWIQMLKDEYELSGGGYSQVTARRLFPHLKDYYPVLCNAYGRLEARLRGGD